MIFTDPLTNLKQFGLRSIDNVADLGAGSGAYTIPAAQIVREGKVYAIEIQKDLLQRINDEANKKLLSNVETIWGDTERVGGTKLKDGIIDAEDACPEVAGTIALRGCPPPANVVKEPVSAPTQPESKPEPDPIQTPVPVGLIKSAVDSLDKPIPDSLSKPVTDSLNSALLDSLHKAGSSSFNHMNLGASKPSISEAVNSSSLNKTFGIIPVATTQTTSANKSENNPHSEPLSKPENTPGDIAAPAPKKASKASTEIDKLEH